MDEEWVLNLFWWMNREEVAEAVRLWLIEDPKREDMLRQRRKAEELADRIDRELAGE
jgi:hypothetical protein